MVFPWKSIMMMMKRKAPHTFLMLAICFALSTEIYRGTLRVSRMRKLVGLVEDDVFPSAPENALVAETTQDARQHDPPPLFVIHMGPGKTASTSIQFYAQKHLGLLQQDNFYFVGHNHRFPETNLHETCRLCYLKSPECAQKWNSFKHIVDNHYKQGHNVFLSEEMLSGFNNANVEKEYLWDHLEPILKNWRVRVIFTYRRYFEWFPSKYHQAYSLKAVKRNKNYNKGQAWPDKGGRIIPSFTSYLTTMMYTKQFRLPPAILQRWQDKYPIQVMDMHQSDGELFHTNFYCQMLPEAAKLCRHLQRNDAVSTSIVTKNPSWKKALHFDMLAVGAYQAGLVDKHQGRTDVTEEIEKHAKSLGLNSQDDFPLECLSEHQSRSFFQESLEFEKSVFPERKGEQELQRLFQQAVNKNMFCSIDVNKTLQDTRWKKFFANLNAEKPIKLETQPS